jgi:hypothetical protein
MLRDLLGPAFAVRYEDFCRLAMGKFDLNTSLLMAAHALRELESMLRAVLAGPMGTVPTIDDSLSEKFAIAKSELRKLGLPDPILTDLEKVLKPKHSHKDQIKLLLGRLELNPDGDIANRWINLTKNVEVAHKRSNDGLRTNEEYRENFQRPFDAVLRAVLTALAGQYTSLIQHVDRITVDVDRARAVAAFRREIPSAAPLQWRFFTQIESGDWLPRLLDSDLLGVPPALVLEGANEPRRFGIWPAGSYLKRMAASTDAATRAWVAKALRTLPSELHPEILEQAVTIASALSAPEIVSLIDLVTQWIREDIGPSYSLGPVALLRKLAEEPERREAIDIAREIFRLWDKEGECTSRFTQHMYEHWLLELRALLTDACGLEALRVFVELLHDQERISGDSRYRHLSGRSIADIQLPPIDIHEALVVAIRDCAQTLIVDQKIPVADVVGVLISMAGKTFVRLALNALALDPRGAPETARSWLLNEEFIDQDWARPEYGALATAWFPSLQPEDQQAIFRIIDALPAKYIEAWKVRIRASEQRDPTAEQIAGFYAHFARELCWTWRTVLPPDRRAIVDRAGDPLDWYERMVASDEPPITADDLANHSIEQIIELLKEWRPSADSPRRTVTALAEEIRQAAVANAAKFSDAAAEFAALKPVYIRRLIEGLQQIVGKHEEINWRTVLELIKRTFARANELIDAGDLSPGDDRSWDWTLKAACDLLDVGLRAGKGHLQLVDHDQVLDLVLDAFALGQRPIEIEDFDAKFGNQPFYMARETLRGKAVELAILFIIWANPDAKLSREGRPATISAEPRIAHALERQLQDRSLDGRIPRAVIGGYLRQFYFNDAAWLRPLMALLFPTNDPDLRVASWDSHLRNGSGPVDGLFTDMAQSYSDEIELLAINQPSHHNDGISHRQRRLADYVMVLLLHGTLPAPILQQFLDRASADVRRHAMGFVGRDISRPAAEIPAEVRARGMAYFESRLAAAATSANVSRFREELSAIGLWLYHAAVDEVWLCDQVLAMTSIGLAPATEYTTINWLEKVATRHPDRAVMILLGLIKVAGTKPSAFTGQESALKAILTVGVATDTVEALQRVREIKGILDSIGVWLELDLDPPKT